MVGFPVQHVIAPLILKHQIDKAFEHALHRMKTEIARVCRKRIMTLGDAIQGWRIQHFDRQ
ncbi:Uncharacterised protein [Vibrio cholerae]|nr:Uncharacterised protein [Vibrio cholerae]